MKLLIDSTALQQILEQGLKDGLWSIDQFNKTSAKGAPVLPRPGFLTEHPQFFDKGFRDLEAFRSGVGRRLL
ncbi:MAG: hypothetical protein VKI42_01020 [Synechococcaceae cyanobacterium]|nr:hypothetical protein [Synechococcaceae cyanobacterium]